LDRAELSRSHVREGGNKPREANKNLFRSLLHRNGRRDVWIRDVDGVDYSNFPVKKKEISAGVSGGHTFNENNSREFQA